ncbi:MAG: hypothetical protein DLD55_03140 [candidate division SR1 bacterium]|nr:MAG: hypothetical protein DLD55_03140 [candidate division SR1 bacterium]
MESVSKKELEQYYIPEEDTEAINRSRILKSTIDAYMSTKDKKIIDIGLGGGFLLKAFSDKNTIENLYGLDISDYQFGKVIKNHGFLRNNLFTGDATQSKTFSDKVFSDQFDIVLCTDVIEHTFDPLALINNLVKITKKGGHIVFNIPLELNLKARILYLLGQAIHNPFCVGGHIRFFKPQQILKFFKERKDLTIIGKDFDMWFGKESFIRTLKHKLANLFPSLFAGRITIILQKK